MMVISMRDSGLRTEQKDKASTDSQMAVIMKAIGKMRDRIYTVKRSFRMGKRFFFLIFPI
jgi:hypothetical protein